MADLDEKDFAALIFKLKEGDLSDIDQAKAIGKELRESNKPTEKILEEIGDFGKMSSLNQKEIAKFVKASGIDITEADEKRSFQQTKDLAEIAFHLEKNQLTKAKATAKENKETFKGIGLTFKGGWIEAKNVWTKGFLGLQETIATNASLDTLTSAISQDFSLLTTEFQGLMALPGMKTIVSSLKYIVAWMAKLLGPMLKRFLLGDKEEGIKNIFGRLKDRFQGKESTYKSKKQAKQEEDMLAQMDPSSAASDEDVARYFGEDQGKDKKSLSKDSGLIPDKDKTKKITKKPDLDTKTFDKEITLLEKALKRLTRAIKRFRKTIDNAFTKKENLQFSKAATEHRKGAGRFRRSLRRGGKSFGRMAKGMGTAVKRFAMVLVQFFIQVGLFIVNMIAAVVGFIAANLPLIALIALVVLIAVGLFFLIKYLYDNWEVVKTKFNMAIKKFKLAFEKVGNWFQDLGEDIAYKIKWLIAKIKDGIASMANKVITKVNRIPGINFEKFEEGRTDRLEGEREDILAARGDRDRQLLADFNALTKNRGKELEDAAKRDADRQADRQAGPSSQQNVTTSIQTDAREVHMSTESTSPRDIAGAQANQALIG